MVGYKLSALILFCLPFVSGCSVSTILPPDVALPENNCQLRVTDVRADSGTFTMFSTGASVEGAGLVVTQMGTCKTPVSVTNGTKTITVTPENGLEATVEE